MPTSFPALLIRHERLRRNWSQQGLCNGICAVSYLSKIEQGKAEPSPEILALLFGRLGIAWHGGQEAEKAKALADQMYDAVLSEDYEAIKTLIELLQNNEAVYLNGPCMLDFLLIQKLQDMPDDVPLSEFENAFDDRQRALWLLICERYDELLLLAPSPHAYARAGITDYFSGRYPQALQRLQRGYELAAEEGRVYVMLECKILLGNCYSDLDDYEAMMQQYRAAERLAKALHDEQALVDLHYNIAATEVQLGRYGRAYEHFSQVPAPTAMNCHKLAVCCEKLGKQDEAFAALDLAEHSPSAYPDHDCVMRMCALVRYRLLHPDYLHDAAYGELLLACFERMRRELSNGYVIFHLPWVEEWYTANRQYKQAYELLRNFPRNSI